MFTFIAPATPRGQLRMRVASFYELLKISLALHMRPLHTLLELLLNIKGLHDLNYIQSIEFLCIVAWHMRVLSLAQCLRLRCRMLRYQKRSKKHISNSNFETSLLQNVTAKKPIGNMYLMYVDMAWFDSLSRLEHMLHSTVWPMHKICPVPMCWHPYPTRTKRIFFGLSFTECYPYNRNLRKHGDPHFIEVISCDWSKLKSSHADTRLFLPWFCS